MVIRPIEPEEYAHLGMLTPQAYTALDGHVSEPDYEEELADVRTRAEAPSTVDQERAKRSSTSASSERDATAARNSSCIRRGG